MLVAAAGGAASCTGAATRHGPPAHVRVTARTRVPAPATSVLAGAPDVVAAGVASRLFASAPVVVVAGPGGPAGLAAAARSALRAHAPLLLTAAAAARAAARTASGPAVVVGAMLRAQIRALDPRAVLAAGVAREVLAARLPGIRVVTDPAMLPATTTPPPLGHLALLVRSGSSDAGTLAAVTTARVAGARVIAVRGADPRADPAADRRAVGRAAPAGARDRGGFRAARPAGSADRRRADRGAAARRRPDPVPRAPAGGPVRSPRRSRARRPGPAGPAGQHRAGQARRRGIPAPDPRPGHTRLRDHRHRGTGATGPGRRLLLPVHRGLPAPLGTPRGRSRDVRHLGPAARPGQPARPGQEIPAAARAARCRAGPGPGMEAGARAAAAAPDRQREHQRGQHRHQMAGRPDRATTTCPRNSSSCTSSGCR